VTRVGCTNAPVRSGDGNEGIGRGVGSPLPGSLGLKRACDQLCRVPFLKLLHLLSNVHMSSRLHEPTIQIG
jgi:hypothetical protein